jgi:copper(I)-binding protein
MPLSLAHLGSLLLPALMAFAAFAATPASAHGYKVGALEVSHPWARETPPGATTGAGFLAVKNTGTTDDRLVAVEIADAAKVEIHQSLTEDGVARMRPLENGVALPAGQETALKPGGIHLMIIGLKGGLAQGDRVPATLVFEKAGRLAIEISVEEMGYGAAAEHSHK